MANAEEPASTPPVSDKSPATAAPAPEKSWLERLSILFAVLGGIIAVVAFLIGYLNPFSGPDLSIWIRKEIPIDLNVPLGSEALPLALTFKGEQIQRATFMDVRLANFGPTQVGGKEPWKLTLKAGENARVIVLPKYLLNPANLEFKVLDSAHSGSADFQLGLLRTADYADFQVIILNPRNATQPEIHAEASRVPEVPRPAVTRRSQEERIEERIQIQVTNRLQIALALVFVAAIIWLGFKWVRVLGKGKLVDFLLRGFAIACFMAVFISQGVSWLLQKLILLKLANPQ